VFKRILYGAGLFLAAVASMLAGGIWLAMTLGTFSVLAGNEFVKMAQAKGFRPSPRIVRSMIVAFYATAAIPYTRKLAWNVGIEHFPFVLLIGICVSFFRLLFRQENPPARIADVATTILGFIYVGFLPAHLILLRNLIPPEMVRPENPLLQPGLAYVTAGLFATLATDVFAYIVGKRFGKTKLYPQVSPTKTVEGAVGGLVAAIFWATLVVYFFETYVPGHPFRGKIWQGPLMGAAVSVAAQLGDLAESMLKRDAGIKDSSNVLPGHGGFLDRGDGLIFGSPIAYYWVCLVVLGIL
jgi:phosphatidate cytidylyltransferase